jgi:anti-sigma B factor antagonist
MLSITERDENGIAILEPDGNIIMGGGSAILRDSMRSLLEKGRTRILINFKGVKYIDSSGIGELVAGSVSISRVGGQLKLSNMTERVFEAMSLSSVLSIFEVYSDEAEALSDFD